MAIRLSGLTSGMDTETIVKELVSAYSLKTTKIEKQQTKLSWKQDAWKDLNTKIYSLYTSVGNLRYSSAYSLKKATISDPTKATVSASSDAVNVTQKLNILSTAQTGYLTGAKLKSGTTSSSTLADLGFTGDKAKLNVLKADGSTKEIEVSSTSKVSDVIGSLKDAGMNASFDSTTGRFFVSAKEAGAANNFTLVGQGEDGQAALSALGLSTSLTTKDQNGNTVFNEAGSYYQNYYKFYDTDRATTKSNVEALLQTYDDAKSSYDTANAQRGITRNKLSVAKADLEEAKKTKASYDNAKSFIQDHDDLEEDQIKNLSKDDLVNTYGMSEDEATTLVADLQTYYADPDVDVDGKVSDLETKISDYEAQIEEYTQTMDTSTETMKNHEFASWAGLSAERREAEVNNVVNNAMQANEILTNDSYAVGVATQVQGSDAEIVLNGVTYTSTSNSFTVNGLTINATGITGPGEENAITVNVATDNQAIYDKIKDFLSQYNSVINEMNKLYNAASAKDYEPLSDDEKDAMSDTEIEKWETKIKDSLLRRDTTLGSVLTAMTGAMAKTYSINDKTYSLSSFGIATLGYFNSSANENYAFHIDGDEDDEKVSGNKDKLMKAINEDPDSVIEFMKQLSNGLYKAVDEKMKSTTLSSAYKVYNDKEMDSLYSSYTTLISKWEDKVSDKEDYYYKKFSAMEKAMTTLQNQSSSLTGLIG